MTRRRLLAFFAILLLVVLAAAGGIAIYLSSPAFDERARRYIVQEIEKQTGASVTLQKFGWNFRQQRFRLDDLTLRGLEPSTEAPLAHFDRIDIGLNFRTLMQRKIDLFDLTVSRPQFHVIVGPDGRTNFPTPPDRGERKPLDFQISIQNFSLVGGSALVNERKIHIDFSLQNLSSLLKYESSREVLETHFRYDGILDRSSEGKPSIPYTLSADMDYTRATLIFQQMTINSGQAEIRLQGRVNEVLSSKIAGKLEYTGNVPVPFLNYFFTKERFAGTADVAGMLEFSRGYFFTRGNMTSDEVDFEGWHATRVSGEYAYHYPDKRLSFRNMKSGIVGGSVAGAVIVENIPGTARVLLDLDYADIDAAALARAYPWDEKYRIFSNTTGMLKGWFEGKLDRYEFSGNADFKSYMPKNTAGLVPLPLDGSTGYEVRPGQARVSNADVKFYSTAVKASGLIHGTMSDLKVDMTSSNLKDAAFLYSDANGSGTFDGILTGRIARPMLDGTFTLQSHVYRDWTIQHAAGGVRLDTQAEHATLRNVRVTQGESQILVNGTAALSGSPVDLRVQSNKVTAADLRTFVNRNLDGMFSGDVRITSLSPNMRLEGDVRADNLSVDGQFIGDARGHVRYFEPAVEVTQLSLRQNGSTLTGDITFNQVTDALKFSARVNSIDLNMFRRFGLPDSVQGVIRQADLRGDGTTTRPNIRGDASLQNLSFFGEVFPTARVELASTASRLDVRLETGRNLSLNAEIDTANRAYPFKARAVFTQYPLQRIARLSEGTISATGSADLSGTLTDGNRLAGKGRIESVDVRVRETVLRTTKPFAFGFDSTKLDIQGAVLTGPSTSLELNGSIGLTASAPLNLGVSGRLDLGVVSAAYPDWRSGGVVNIEGNIRGTTQAPDLTGFANFTNASLLRTGFFTSLTNVNGLVAFNRDQIRLNDIRGQIGGGTVQAQGTALLRDGSVQNMNIQIEANDVRVRGYPEGVRTVLNGDLVLQGTLDTPLLEGNLEIQSLAYRSSFEEFLALLTEQDGPREASPFGRLRLSLHIEGSRNITIQNQLADVEARVDVDVKGTFDDPSLTGHVEASGGTLLFQGNRYTITRGNIDFVDPLRIEPVVDVQAESEVRDYRIILSVTGRGDKLRLDLRSDPPLPEIEIVSLVAGGRTREELRYDIGRTNAPTNEQLFQSSAASILFDLLQQRVGNRLGLLGLDRVRIDPFTVGASNNPGARITLSEQVTKDLSVTYSQDLASNRQQVILIEYFLNRNTSIVASRDELGNFGLDIRLRKRLK